MILRKPKREEYDVYKKLEIEFYLQHKPYKTLLQDVDSRKRDLKKEFLGLIRERNSFFRFVECNHSTGVVTGGVKTGVIRQPRTTDC